MGRAWVDLGLLEADCRAPFLWMLVAIVVRVFSVFFARFCHVSEHEKNDRFALCRVPFFVRVRDRFLGASEVTFGTSFW